MNKELKELKVKLNKMNIALKKAQELDNYITKYDLSEIMFAIDITEIENQISNLKYKMSGIRCEFEKLNKRNK
tara:strand:+ start:458 stop:676 length:219 start_codon:yes stop_codon:yes gene_type:complete